MEEDGFGFWNDSSQAAGALNQAHVAIVGLGLMGGSLAMALHGKCKMLSGVDPNQNALDYARQCRCIDQSFNDICAISPAPDLLILATPVNAILRLIHQLPNTPIPRAIIIDLGSTKRAILSAMDALPHRFEALGGHPMCGKENASIQNASADLFIGAPFVLAPLPQTTARATHIALQLVQAIGAHPIWLDAETHDRWTAATSHFPYIISTLLSLVTPLEVSPLAGSGFQSTTRIAATPLSMMGDVLQSNRDNLLTAIAGFRNHLEQVEQMLQREQYDQLAKILQQGANQHHQLLNDKQQGSKP